MFAAFRTRLRQSGPGMGEVLRTLADVTTPALARSVAAMVREAVELRPEAAAHVAAYVDRRLEYGPTTRAVLFPLVSGLLEGCPASVRAALVTVLAAPGSHASRPLRRELLDLLLAHERDPAVLDTLLKAAAAGADRRVRRPRASWCTARASSSSAPRPEPPASTAVSSTWPAKSRVSPPWWPAG